MFDTLIRGGTLIDGTGAPGRRADVGLRDGRIAAIGELSEPAAETLDAQGRVVAPGFIDIHVHCRDDPGGSQRHKEDYSSASEAAIQGGVVLVGDMPNNPDPPCDLESYLSKRNLADERSIIDVVLYGLLIRGGTPFRDDIPWKCYFGPSVGDVDSWGDSTVEEVLAPFGGQMVMFHAEDPAILALCSEKATHEQRRPAEAEVEAIRTILRRALERDERLQARQVSADERALDAIIQLAAGDARAAPRAAAAAGHHPRRRRAARRGVPEHP